MKYNKIRKDYQDHNYLEKVFIDPYAMIISPIYTKYLLKLNLKPNYITIMMMLFGILGAIFFSFNNVFMKILGVFFIHSWYILDCSDGEVARITKTFSKFGKEIDFTAHVINHPLFNIAFLLSLVSLNKYNSFYLAILFMILICFDLMNRNVSSFYVIYDIKMTGREGIAEKNLVKKIIIYVTSIFVDYPNFALIFPIIYFIDAKYNSNFSIIYIYTIIIFQILIISRILFKWVMTIKDL